MNTARCLSVTSRARPAPNRLIAKPRVSKVAMVVAPVHPVPPRHGAAVEWWAYQVSLQLDDLERVVVCIHADGYAPAETVGGVRIHRIRIGRVYRRLFQKITRLDPNSYAHRAARIIRGEKADIVHVHNAPLLLDQLIRLMGVERYRYFLHMHNHMELPPTTIDVPLIACSGALARWYRERFKSKVAVITNGVDAEVFQPAWLNARVTGERRRMLGIPSHCKVVLYVGRLSPEKGTLDLVRAFHELLRLRSDVYLLLIGEARTGDLANPRVRYAAEIIAACKQISGDCRLLGTVDPKTIQDYYVIADLSVVPSEFEEPFGMVAIEA